MSYITIREKNGYSDGAFYDGPTDDMVFLNIKEKGEEIDCSEEDKIVYLQDVFEGDILLRGKAAEKMKDAKCIYDYHIDHTWYHIASKQQKFVLANGDIVFSFSKHPKTVVVSDGEKDVYQEAKENIELGLYQHYKGNKYEVIGIARHSETLKPMVIYRALYGNGDIWCRPADMWNEMVIIDDVEITRFRKID